jgi:hypothetical protein
MTGNRSSGQKRICKAADPIEGLAKQMLGHFIPYEVGMMRALHKKLGTPSPTQLDRNADIESFHVHARNLIELFTNNKQCAIDPRAFTTNDYQINGDFIPRTLKTKISQQIVHLAHERTDVDADKLSDDERNRTVTAIEKEIKRFEEALRSTLCPVWVEGLKQMDFQRDIHANKPTFGATGSSSTVPPTTNFPLDPVHGATNHIITAISSGSPTATGPTLKRDTPKED